MKNKILVFGIFVLFAMALFNEPVKDTTDIVAGATNSTYHSTIDLQSGVSSNFDEHDDDYEDDN